MMEQSTAKAFLNVYAKVSSVDRSIIRTLEERKTERELRRTVHTYCAREPIPDRQGNRQYIDHSSPFSMIELGSTLAQMLQKSSPGQDRIHSRMLHNLDPDLKLEVSYIINLSWRQGRCPSHWCSGVIVPVSKSSKPAGELDSYRPVCLQPKNRNPKVTRANVIFPHRCLGSLRYHLSPQ